MELTAQRDLAAAFCPKETASESTAFLEATLIGCKICRSTLPVKFSGAQFQENVYRIDCSPHPAESLGRYEHRFAFLKGEMTNEIFIILLPHFATTPS